MDEQHAAVEIYNSDFIAANRHDRRIVQPHKQYSLLKFTTEEAKGASFFIQQT